MGSHTMLPCDNDEGTHQAIGLLSRGELRNRDDTLL